MPGMQHLLAAATLAVVLSTCATPPAPERPRGPDLDILLARLQAAGDPREAERIETLILEAWSRSGDAGVDALMVEGVRALYRRDHRTAVAIFNEVVAAVPGFADGWRWRGTARYLAGDHLAAVVDLRHSLALEPRHFGAWLAVARAFAELEALEEAIFAYRVALGLNPHLNEARQRLHALEETLAGLAI